MTSFVAAGERTAPPERLSTTEKAVVLVTGVRLPRPANGQYPADVGLASQTCTIRGEKGVDLEAWWIPHPEPRACVLLFHGYSACKGTLLPEARAFFALGCEIFLVDFRGSGGSSGNVTTLGVHEAEDVVQAVKYARAHSAARPLILYGRSMGGAAILRAIAKRQLRSDGVIVECPFDRLVSTVGNRFSSMGLPSFPMAQLLVFWGGVQQGMNGFAHNPADYAACVHCPTLVMHGSLDPRVSIGEVQAVHAALTGDKQLTFFPRAAHESYLAVDPDLWTATVSGFLERCHAIND
jgi:alpha-beta hydrolase superfamily lysophospholipase